MSKIRIGLLGGTFNPVHRGHVDLGLHIHKAFQLDKILYILSAQPPHKQDQNIAPPTLRFKMLGTALEKHPRLEPCDIEMKRNAWSWTIDTIKELKHIYPQSHMFFISGSEGFLKIRTWKNYKELLQLVSFIVVLRKPGHREAVEDLMKDENVETLSAPDSFKDSEMNTPAVYMYAYQSDKLFISSTLVRERVKSAQPIDGLVEEEVEKIMEDNKLYERRGF